MHSTHARLPQLWSGEPGDRDAVVAIFGAPIAHADDPKRAVRAALAINSAVEELNASDEWLDIHLRTAVYTGEALVVLGASAVEAKEWLTQFAAIVTKFC